MPAAHRPLSTDHPADNSTPADAVDATVGSDETTNASDRTSLEWLATADRPRAHSTDGLTEPRQVLAAELECARLRARVLELEAALNARERERQDVIDRYEHLLDERGRPTPIRRQSFGAGLLERLRRVLASHTR